MPGKHRVLHKIKNPWKTGCLKNKANILCTKSIKNVIISCVGGGIQFVSSPSSIFQTGPLTLCGDNERYSPPVVMFLDEGTQGSPVLLVGVDQATTRSQFLAHFSFTAGTDQKTGLRMSGGTRLTGSGMKHYKKPFWQINFPACSYEYTEASCAGVPHCEISSPGYPGIFPQNMLCRCHVKTQGKGVRIKINNLSIPKDKR